MHGFYVGDRVVVTGYNDEVVFDNKRIRVGMKGIIVCIREDENIGVQFDINISGHHCNGAGKYGYCWYVIPEVLSYVSMPELNICELI